MSGPFGSSNFFSGTAVAAAYTIDNSCMFDGAADYLHFTPGTPTDNNVWTFSCWAKIANVNVADNILNLLDGTASDSDQCYFRVQSSKLRSIQYDSGYQWQLNGSPLLRDSSAWYHFMFCVDTGAATEGQRLRQFINGVPVTSFTAESQPSADLASSINESGRSMAVGRSAYGSSSEIGYMNGYLAEVIFIDGLSLNASSFGEFNSDGIWIPIDPSTLTFGNNGFWLDFEDSSDLGNDVSGKGNDFTSSGLAAANQVLDSPTDSGTTIGNYATWNPLWIGQYMLGETNTFSDGNLTYTGGDTGGGARPMSTIPMVFSQSWYVEVTYDVVSAGTEYLGLIFDPIVSSATATAIMYASSGVKSLFNVETSYGATWTAGDVIGIHYDSSSDELSFYKNGNDEGVAATSVSNTGDQAFVFCFLGRATDKVTINSGQSAFTGTAPAGALPLCTANLPAPTITKPTDQFLPIVYEGNGTSQRVGNFIPFTDTFAVDDSCRFDTGDSDYLTRTPSENGSQTTWTSSIWLKRGELGLNYGSFITGYKDGSNYIWLLATGSSDQLFLQNVVANAGKGTKTTDRLFKNTSSWTNIVTVWDTTNVTASDRTRRYVNGVRLTNFSASTDPEASEASQINSTAHSHQYNAYNGTQFGDGYLAEVVFIDGTALEPSSFGETDTSTGRWIPKDVSGLTFGTNGHYLAFASENNLGDDTSGNGNDFTEYNLDSTNGSNQMYDTPSQNFANLSVGFKGPNFLLEEGNLQWDGEASATSMNEGTFSTMIIPSSGGKFFFEWEVIQPNNNYDPWAGIIPLDGTTFDTSSNFLRTGSGWALNGTGSGASSAITGLRGVHDGTFQDAAIISCTDNDTIGLYLDADNGVFYVNVNGGSLVTVYDGLPVGTAFRFAIQDGGQRQVASGKVNFGQWRYWDSTTLTLDTDAGGYFRYAAIGEYKALQQDNLPESTAGITGFSWIKNRDALDNHILQTRVTGIYNYVESNTTDGQVTDTNTVQRFLQQGVQIGNNDEVNTVSEGFVLWQWANDGAETTNSVGTIDSLIRVNDAAGFSFGTYVGTGANGTIGHGQSAAPVIVMHRNLSTDGQNWDVGSDFLTSWAVRLYLDTNGAEVASTGSWNSTAPSATVISLGGSGDTNASGDDHLFFAWRNIEGYSSFGSYEGNDDADGPFIYLGFRPAMVIGKNIDSAGNDWWCWDSSRSPTNIGSNVLNLSLNDAAAESYFGDYDMLSNGFKMRTTNSTGNASNTYIYCAWAENPFGGSGVAQARAR